MAAQDKPHRPAEFLPIIPSSIAGTSPRQGGSILSLPGSIPSHRVALRHGITKRRGCKVQCCRKSNRLSEAREAHGMKLAALFAMAGTQQCHTLAAPQEVVRPTAGRVINTAQHRPDFPGWAGRTR